jgi:hypothetical protein
MKNEELLAKFFELNHRLTEEKDALRRLEIKIDLIHLREELKNNPKLPHAANKKTG